MCAILEFCIRRNESCFRMLTHNKTGSFFQQWSFFQSGGGGGRGGRSRSGGNGGLPKDFSEVFKRVLDRYSVYVLYWCKSTNTDAARNSDIKAQPRNSFFKRVLQQEKEKVAEGAFRDMYSSI